MKEYLTIGSTPAEEECFPVGHDLALAETRIYKNQLLREFPEADVRVKSFPHDFGTYHEVCVFYFDDDEDSMAMAWAVEADAAPKWDAIAKKELRALKANYSLNH